MSVSRVPLPGADRSVVDECADRLRLPGWTCADFSTAGGWRVCGTNGENVLRVTAPTHALAWQRAVEAARAVGMPR